MWWDVPIISSFEIFVVLPLVLFGPAVVGAIITAASVVLVRDNGGTWTVRRAGYLSVIAGYAAGVVGAIVIFNIEAIDPHVWHHYALAWWVVCALIAYGAIIATACYCWSRPWRFP